MRYLAIDLGGKRTGLAVGDDVLRMAGPLEVIVATDDATRLKRIGDAIESQGPDALVVGLPLNMDGSPGPAAKNAQAFGDSLAARFNLPVHYMDERLSSDAANARMAQTGLTHKQKKNRRDALAAAAILQDFLDQV